MSKLLIYFECETENFGTIMGAIGPSMTMVQALRVETPNEAEKRTRRCASPARTPDNPHSISSPNWRNWKSSKVQKAIIECLKQTIICEASYDHIKEFLTIQGFAESSFSPATSHMVRAGIVERLPMLRMCLTDEGKKL